MRQSMKNKAEFLYLLYLYMGPARSLNRLAEDVARTDLRTSLTQLKRYSSKYDWQTRVQEYDLGKAHEIKERTTLELIAEKTKFRRIIQDCIAQFVKNFNENGVNINSVSDFEKLVKLDLLLMGEATEQVLISTVENLVRRFVEIFKESSRLDTDEERQRAFVTQADQVLIDQYNEIEGDKHE